MDQFLLGPPVRGPDLDALLTVPLASPLPSIRTVPLVAVVATSKSPLFLLARTAAQHPAPLASIALFTLLALHVRRTAAALRRNDADLAKRGRQLAWVARQSYALVAAACVVSAAMHLNALGAFFLTRIVLMVLSRVAIDVVAPPDGPTVHERARDRHAARRAAARRRGRDVVVDTENVLVMRVPDDEGDDTYLVVQRTGRVGMMAEDEY
ncbi:hypothetical protein AMAG_02359 [Allomyces macrogynus ATCC 38327]|uniref:Uncharacterized protein n=1 Tax=Allomyces macrogynus (strain ATCC 38327) TaxID=578462 RepID=A0A0L0S2E0_ALLM3|nr:hypothetical protein AMAG_02359 [Allomyces macrogynus ATCC 38327]|eukprot:KNE56561.1 hypothetical protein AMAG_02359 [Allomyces macrogynus ATCC 38327]